jgi:hypothetical protein
MRIKGIYPQGIRFRVRKYGVHIGVYNTLNQAEEAALKYEKEQEVFKYMKQYREAKEWLTKNGIL